MHGTYYLNAGILFKIARVASSRLGASASEDTGGQNDAIIAILFAAATLEAPISEFELLAKQSAALGGASRVAATAGLLAESEKSHDSIRLKYLLAKAVLSGQPYDKGAQPYHDLDLLFSLRDALVHIKPEEVGKEPHVLKAMRAKGLCSHERPNNRELARTNFDASSCRLGVRRCAEDARIFAGCAWR